MGRGIAINTNNRNRLNVILIAIFTSLACTLVQAKDTVPIAYKAEYEGYDFIGFGDSIEVKHVIGENFDEFFSKRWMSNKQRTEVKYSVSNLKSIESTDTIVIITEYNLLSIVDCIIKAGNNLTILQSYQTDSIEIVTSNCYFEEEPSLDYLSQIMFNVIFTWNDELIRCLFKSSGCCTNVEDWYTAERIIINNGKIIGYERMSYATALIWNLNKCYGKNFFNYPKEVLRNLRYNKCDSLILKYIPKYDYKFP